jgi:hypothetical protein
MSGIEYYPCAARDMTLADHAFHIQIALTWNGQVHTERPTWREEFEAWKTPPRE